MFTNNDPARKLEGEENSDHFQPEKIGVGQIGDDHLARAHGVGDGQLGLLPHPSPTGVFASEYYRTELGKYAMRLGIDQMGFTDMIPRLWLPDFLRNTLGYHTRAIVSLPVLNPHTPLNADFDSYTHYMFRAMHRFDYSVDDCMEFHNSIEAVCMPILSEINNERSGALGIGKLSPWDVNEKTGVGPDIHGREPLRPFQTVDEMMWALFFGDPRVTYERLLPHDPKGYLTEDAVARIMAR